MPVSSSPLSQLRLQNSIVWGYHKLTDLSRIVWNFPLAPENFLALNGHRILLVMKFTVCPVPEIVAVSQ